MRWNPPRGGPTAFAGLLLLLLGFVGAFLGAAGQSQSLFDALERTWLPVSPVAIAEAYLLLAGSVVAGAVGAIALIVSRSERDREEETHLDPLAYAPVRTVHRRAIVAASAVVVLTVVPALFFLPVAQSVSFSVPVVACGPTLGNETALSLPLDAVLTYSWRAPNHDRVDFVRTPSGPASWGRSVYLGNFSNSSAGWSEVVGNGSPMFFYACDAPARLAGGPVVVIVTGTYYTRLL